MHAIKEGRQVFQRRAGVVEIPHYPETGRANVASFARDHSHRVVNF